VNTTLAAVLSVTMRLVAAHEYPDGAPPGFSGGFKEESCHACHFHAAPNLEPGRVVIDGVPARFAAGDTYTLTVTLTRAGMKRAGFQLAARFTDNGAQAGTLAPGPAEKSRVGVELQSGIQYANQKKDGASIGAPDVTRWTIDWTAPARSAPVVFHVSANAADGNDSADGDFVYTASVESSPRELFVPQGVGRIDVRGAPRGNGCGHDAGGDDAQQAAGVGHGVEDVNDLVDVR
jgi:hypothetical protein